MLVHPRFVVCALVHTLSGPMSACPPAPRGRGTAASVRYRTDGSSQAS